MPRSRFRPPRPAIALLAGAFLVHVVIRAAVDAPDLRAPVLRHPPSGSLLRVAAAGDPAALARGLMLWLQAFDYRSGASFSLSSLDYRALAEWLDRILGLAPGSEYPLRAAVQVYANVASPEQVRVMLDFAYAKFLEDPQRRWRWLAVAVLQASHRLADRPLALKYALALTDRARGPGVASWARDMSLLLLRDMGEHRAAAVLARRPLARGRLTEGRDLRFLERESLRTARSSGPQ